MSTDTPREAQGIVRKSKRPPGWTAPGPPPAGPGEDPELWPKAGEDLCYLSGDWRIFQRIEGHRWSLDDLLTAWYGVTHAPARVERALDLGCGIGSVLMIFAPKNTPSRIFRAAFGIILDSGNLSRTTIHS